ncbi:MAG: ankyrin repeat domain-containing protein [Pseudomonadota bacterium]
MRPEKVDNFAKLEKYFLDQAPKFAEIQQKMAEMMPPQIKSMIVKMMIDLDKIKPATPDNLMELQGFWATQVDNVAPESAQNLLRKTNIAQTLARYKKHLIDKGVDLESLSGLEDQKGWQEDPTKKGRWRLFDEYLQNMSSQGETGLLMKEVCKCCDLLCAQEKLDDVEESLKEFPPQRSELACPGGSFVRCQTVIRKLSAPSYVQQFLGGYDMAIGRAIENLKEDVIPGRHIHIKPLVEYCAGFVAQELILDTLFNSPLDEIDPLKLLKVVTEFSDHLKEFWLEYYENNSVFLFAINNCYEYETNGQSYDDMAVALEHFEIALDDVLQIDDDSSKVTINWEVLAEKLIAIQNAKFVGFERFCSEYLEKTPDSLRPDEEMDGVLSDGSSGSEKIVVQTDVLSRSQTIKKHAEKMAKMPMPNLDLLWVASYLPNGSADNHLVFIRAIYDIGKALPNPDQIDYLKNVKLFLEKIRDEIPAEKPQEKSRVQDIIERLDLDKFKYLFGLACNQDLIAKAPADVDSTWQSLNDEQRKTIFSLAIETGLGKAVVKLLNQHIFPVDVLLNNDGDTPLHIAAQSKNGHYVFAGLIASGADINKPNLIGQTPLMSAIQDNNALAIQEILKVQGIKFRDVDDVGNSLMHYAAASQDQSLVKKFVDHCVDIINQPNQIGTTPLMMAAEYNHHYAVTDLLARDEVNPNVQSANGWSALTYALNNQNLEMCLALQKRGANIDEEIFFGEGRTTILNWAINSGHDELMNFLLQNHVQLNLNLNQANSLNGNTPLHEVCNKGELETVQFLIDAGVDINKTNLLGRTPLYSAISRVVDSEEDESVGMEIIQFLFNSDVDMNQVNERPAIEDENNPFFATALEYACFTEDFAVVKLLIEKGALIDSCLQEDAQGQKVMKNLIGDNAEITNLVLGTEQLMRGVHSVNAALVRQAIKSGAIIDYVDEDGNDVLHNACYAGNEEIAGLLIRNGADFFTCFSQIPLWDQEWNDDIKKLLENHNNFFAAIEKGDVSEVRSLLRGGFEFCGVLKDNKSAFRTAVLSHNPETLAIVQLLAEAGACIFDCPDDLSGVDENTQNFISDSKDLLLQIEDLDLEEMEDAIKMGASVNVIDREGFSALFALVKSSKEGNVGDNIEKIKLLLNAGANINAKDNDGDTLLHWAIAQKKPAAILNLLIEKGIDFEAKNNKGETALEAAHNSDEDYSIHMHIVETAINKKRLREDDTNAQEEPNPKSRRLDPKRTRDSDVDQESASQDSDGDSAKKSRTESPNSSPKSPTSEIDGEKERTQ